MALPVESEIKLRVEGPEAARRAVAALGAAAAQPRHLEDNILYDDAARSLVAAGGALRLRRAAGRSIVTFKGPRQERADGVKSRTEIETDVADGEALDAILRALGYAKVFRYQKYRESYHWRDVEIVVDETPIGTFLEIEGPVATIHEAARALGRAPQDYIADSYAALFFASGGVGDMVFGVKAMILAAGLGTRMRPLTLDRAKPVLPVLNRPLLHWTLEMLAAHGVDEAMINTHYLPRSVRAAVGNGSAFGIEVSYSFEKEILGTGGGPRKVRRWVGDEPLLLLNGDVVFDFDLSAMRRRHDRSGAPATLALIPNPDPRHYSPVITGPDGYLRALAGLPRRARGTVSMFTGVHILDPALLDRLPPGPSDTVRQLYAPLIAEGNPPLGMRLKGPWYDLGSPSLYLASQQSLLASRFRGARRGTVIHPEARVDPRARVVRSVVGKGVVIAAGAEVRGSVLWDRVKVGRDAVVEDSILAAGVKLEDGEALRSSLLMKDQPLIELKR